MTHSEEIVIVCGSDNNYVMPMAVALYSAVVNCDEGVKFAIYILDAGISDIKYQRLTSVLNSTSRGLQIHRCVAPVAGLENLRTQGSMTKAVYVRLLMSELLPLSIAKVLYIDCDLIVEGNIAQLWNQDVSKHTLRAVQDFGVQYVSYPWGVAKFEELSFQAGDAYFNSGVMVINLERWRAEKVSEATISYLQNYSQYLRCHDQEGLNVALRDKWGSLDPRWNQLPGIFAFRGWPYSTFKESIEEVYRAVRDRPYIIHYASSPKPWHCDCKHPSQHRFFYYLRISGWFTDGEWVKWWWALYAKRIAWVVGVSRHHLKTFRT